MDTDMGVRVIPSTGKVTKYGVIRTRGSLGPRQRFIFEGELDNPEHDTRNALVTVKDLSNHKIQCNLLYIH